MKGTSTAGAACDIQYLISEKDKIVQYSGAPTRSPGHRRHYWTFGIEFAQIQESSHLLIQLSIQVSIAIAKLQM